MSWIDGALRGRGRGSDLMLWGGALSAGAVSAMSHGLSLYPMFNAHPLGSYLADAMTPGTPAALVWFLLVPFVGSAALWWRRRAPVGVTLGLLAASTVAPLFPAALFGLATVVASRQRRTVATTAGLALLPLALQPLVHPVPLGEAGATAFTTSALLTGAVMAGLYVRSRAERRAQAEVEAVLRAQAVRRQEREELAREMHDVLAHRLSLLSMHAGALGVNPTAPPEQITASVEVIRSSAVQALEDLQQVLGVLRSGPRERTEDAPDPPQPGFAHLPALVAESARAGMHVELNEDLRPDLLPVVPELVGRTAYRIVREALTNVRKHAPGGRVRIDLHGSPAAGLTVEVSNTIPAAADHRYALPGSGSGLRGLAGRVDLIGGEFSHGPADGVFLVKARLPWPA
ncbi:sensor histidine kinase [Streptomyces sp. NPDC051555]|uniref:sensor histidine kinase n=1 Tax=Streptomyces sp. NPDC051555 TaxID=3365657 RepID=UPI0037949D21